MKNPEEIFGALKAILSLYKDQLDCKIDSDDSLSIDTLHLMDNKKPLFFGAVHIMKNYVSYHLMPVYVNPGLLDAISPDLRKHMQGKSCFNFKSVDATLFEELKTLTRKCYEYYQAQGYI